VWEAVIGRGETAEEREAVLFPDQFIQENKYKPLGANVFKILPLL
jgi:hypothetical protein